jgi:twinkle protein
MTAEAFTELTTEAVEYLKARGIPAEVATRYGVKSTSRYFSQLSREGAAIAFVHTNKDGSTRNIKFRSIEGKFFTAYGQQTSYWAQEHVEPGKPLVITEGEMDALSCLSAGVDNAVSVPSGAPSPRSDDGGDQRAGDAKLSYVVQGADLYDQAGKIVLALDSDVPGRALGEELARRIGKERCWFVTYPDGCKDTNDVLVKHGPDAVRKAIDEAAPWPVAGLYDANHYYSRVQELYAIGAQTGFRTGLKALDSLMTIVPGQMSIVTGAPGSGKSALIDQIVVNLAVNENWSFCMASFENPPAYHLIKLLENNRGKPFYEGPLPRLNEEDFAEGMVWAQRHFNFVEAGDGMPTTIDDILERARISIMRTGARGLVIDPYNYIEKPHSERFSETDYVSDMLTKIRRFSIGHDVHTWLIAHPAKMGMMGEDGNPRIPGGYDISGSAHFFNKADLGITVHRIKDRTQAMVRVWKVRFKWCGKVGDALLNYDIPTGRYSDGQAATNGPQKETNRPSGYWYE